MPSRSSRAHVHQSPVRAGPKASLLAGGDGRALQQLTLQVPANRLHLVSVDTQGVARLKLRPRFEMDGDLGVVRIDAAPRYGTPPTVEDLYRAAARNHELERTYDAERRAQRTTRRDTDRERRERVAQAFHGDTGQRAVAHPPPSEWRIVSDELWRRVRERRKDVEGKALRFSAGRMSGRPPKHGVNSLLAGLATCTLCGGGLVVETSKGSLAGRDNRTTYATDVASLPAARTHVAFRSMW